MPFGRFRNMPLTALSDGYLHWLASLPTLRPPLRGAVLAEIARRAADILVGTLPPPIHKVIEELVGAGLRALARKHHPDVGGDTKKMQEINSAAEWLRRAAGGRT